MKVKLLEYVAKDTYHHWEAARYVIGWANEIMRKNAKAPTPEYYVAGQIKSIVYKRYAIRADRFIPLCKRWELHPDEMMAFVIEHKQQNVRRLGLKRGATEYSPDTVKL